MTSEASIGEALASAGELDAIVNNPASHGQGPREDYPFDRLREVFETNTFGAARLLQHVLPSWRVRGHGVIVNVNSVQGRVSSPLEGVYTGPKHALGAFPEALH